MEVAQYLQSMPSSYIREILSEATAEGVISLAGGLPASDKFPLQLMQESMMSLTQRPELFQYGETAGYRPLLDYLKQEYKLTDTERAMICTGSQQGLDLIARTFLDKNDCVVVEEPAYLGALQVFAMAQARIEPVPQTMFGPDLEKLEALFITGKVKMFYTVPDFHNPTGVCWSLDVRQKVAGLCRLYKVTLIEDAPYRELRFVGETLPMVSSFCREHALVLRSFSKIATPGIRMACVYGPGAWIAQLIKVKQAADLHSSQPLQAVLLDLLQHVDFPEHLSSLCELYGKKCTLLSELLQEKLPWCEFNSVQGGMFLWLTLTKGDAMEIAKECLKHGVAVVPGSVFYSEKSLPAACELRLNFSHGSEQALEEAILRLAIVLKNITGYRGALVR